MTCKYRLDILYLSCFRSRILRCAFKDSAVILRVVRIWFFHSKIVLCLRFWTKPCQSTMPRPWRVYWKSSWFSGRAFTEAWRATRRPEATLSASSPLCSPSTWRCSRWDRHPWRRRNDVCAEGAGCPTVLEPLQPGACPAGQLAPCACQRYTPHPEKRRGWVLGASVSMVHDTVSESSLICQESRKRSLRTSGCRSTSVSRAV